MPVSLGLLLDASDSMRGQPVVDARDAFDRFVGDLLLTEDEVFVATFNHLPRLVTKWTMPPSSLRGSLDVLKPSGGTAIYDALADTSRLFEQRVNLRAAMIVVSDGADTASDRSLLQTIDVDAAERRVRLRDCDRCAGRPREHAGQPRGAARHHRA